MWRDRHTSGTLAAAVTDVPVDAANDPVWREAVIGLTAELAVEWN
jgi:hypothetical protein